MSQSKRYTDYLKTYNGSKLVKNHSLSESGQWQIYGEDPNCDLGGYHHQPNLGTVEGVLKDVIQYAVELKSFWTWGGGGEIRKINIQKITPGMTAEMAELRLKQELLQKELEEVQASLKKLGA